MFPNIYEQSTFNNENYLTCHFQIFYTMTAVEDLDEWQQKTVALTESADLVNLEKYAQYAIAVAARTKNVSVIFNLIFFENFLILCAALTNIL